MVMDLHTWVHIYGNWVKVETETSYIHMASIVYKIKVYKDGNCMVFYT